MPDVACVPLLHLQGDNKGFLVCKKKMATSADLLCRCAWHFTTLAYPSCHAIACPCLSVSQSLPSSKVPHLRSART